MCVQRPIISSAVLMVFAVSCSALVVWFPHMSPPPAPIIPTSTCEYAGLCIRLCVCTCCVRFFVSTRFVMLPVVRAVVFTFHPIGYFRGVFGAFTAAVVATNSARGYIMFRRFGVNTRNAKAAQATFLARVWGVLGLVLVQRYG